MQTASVSPLQPASVPQLLDRTFRIYRENFLPFFGLVAVVTIPLTIFELVSQLWMNSQLARGAFGGAQSSARMNARMAESFLGEFANLFALTLIISAIVAIIQAVLVNGVLTYMVSERYMGRQVTLGEAFRAVRGRLPKLGIGLVVFYLIMGLVVAGLAAVFFACGLGLGAIVYLGIALYAFLTPVLILERTSLGLGLKRAWILGKARIWPVAGLIIVVTILTSIISFAALFSQQMVTTGTIATTSFTSDQVLQTVVQMVIAAFVAPVLPIGLTLMYYDTRVRLEGLDIALNSVPAPEPRPADVISPDPTPGWFMSGRDFTNLGIFAVGGLVLIALLFGIMFLIVGGISRIY